MSLRITIADHMFSDKQLHLTGSILGIHTVRGTRTAIMIPVGAIVRAVGSPPQSDSRLVDVHWEGKRLAVFVVDLFQRGKEIESVEDSRAASG